MATIVLQAAGAWLGGALGAVGSAVGSAAGALAGYMVDRAILTSNQRYEGPRLTSAHLMTAEEGSPLPRVYGTVRVGGALIWATRFEEQSTTTRQGAKGGPKQTNYAYYANAAFALCEGEIAGVRRIWADGRELDLGAFEVRIYRGSEDQAPDPLIEAKQGGGNTPSYRGTAYVVFERFPLDDFGRRLPQFQFEVLRPEGELHKRIRSVALIPGATEYGLSPTLVTASNAPGETIAVNRHNLHGPTDFEAALDELQVVCPNLSSVALVVSWFGTDLRAGQCQIKPMVVDSGGGFSEAWQVSSIGREAAQLVSRHDGRAAYGGSPSDKSVIAAIRAIRARGLKVNLYPFIMMDIAAENERADPYSDGYQAAYPWRGRITCEPARGRVGSPDKTGAVREQVDAFVGQAAAGSFQRTGDRIDFLGNASEWSFRRHIFHYAWLAKAAGGVDGFIIGSEMPGLTGLRAEDNAFPFVEKLVEIATEVRALLGAETTITYAADWSEYFGYQPADGTGDVFFHLDALWASPAISCVGIDNYMPLSDWRDEDASGGNLDGFGAPYEISGLRAGIASGEGFDWYYASDQDRAAQSRSVIRDGAYDKDWVFRYKDLTGWWSNAHFNRVGGVEVLSPTAWVPKSKPFQFLEVGCGAVDKGPNQPNVFPDPKSGEDAIPYFSNGGRSDLAQYRFLLAHHLHWQAGGDAANPVSDVYGGRMVDPEGLCVWAWDLRPFPAFPIESDVWGDGANWGKGHWLNGRISSIPVSALINAILDDHGLPLADTAQADGMVSGYIVSNPTTARAALEPIVGLFGIGVRAGAEQLVFATQGASGGAAKVLWELVLPDEGEVITRIRAPDHGLPASAQLDFRDQLNEHQSATASVNYLGAKGSGTSFVSFPGVLAAAEANGLITGFLRRTWDKREQVSFAVPITQQAIGVGSVVRLGDERREYLVTEIEEGLIRKVRAEQIVRIPDAPAFGGDLPDRMGVGSFVFGRPHVLWLDLPLGSSERLPQDQLRIAARAKPWKAQAAYCSPEEAGFSLRTVTNDKAIIGSLLTPLLSGQMEGRFDLMSTPVVKLLDGELESVSRGQLLNGANVAAVLSSNGIWEIVQFQYAQEVEVNSWQLSGLLRGQLGTCDAMQAGAEVGAPFVLLNEAVGAAGLKADEIGLALNWRVGPVGSNLTDAHFASTKIAGGLRALLPLAPVHLCGRMDSGDFNLSWIRRGRVDADSWLHEDIRLGEEAERYLVEIEGDGGGAVIRTVMTTEPRWVYAEDMMVSDFGIVPDSIVVRVSQVSASVGAGVIMRKAIAVH